MKVENKSKIPNKDAENNNESTIVPVIGFIPNII